jgi:hypothetical protein
MDHLLKTVYIKFLAKIIISCSQTSFKLNNGVTEHNIKQDPSPLRPHVNHDENFRD